MMEGDANEMLGIILLGVGVVTLLLALGGDDDGGDETDDSLATGYGTAGTPGDDDVPAITPAGHEGDNIIGNSIDAANGDTEGYVLSASQKFFVGAGNDAVFAGGGDDTVFGGSGNDSLNGSTGNDDVYGGSGNDTVIGGHGDDLMVLGLGEDQTLSEALDAAINATAPEGAALSDVDAAMNELESDFYAEMGGDDIILGGVSHEDEGAGTDGGDTIIDLIGSNQLNGAVGGDTIVALDRDSTEDNVPPKGDVINGGFNYDEIWADDGDVVTLDPAAEDAPSADDLIIANALSGRGEVADLDDGVFDANDYVTVTDFDPQRDNLALLSETFTADSLTFEADGDNVVLKSGDEVIVQFNNIDVAAFDNYNVEVVSSI